jgi:polar amino acid transport system ATP-binding protein
LIAPRLAVENLVKRYGSTTALAGVSFEGAAGEVVCVVGPSGCGKTTLLRCITVLDEADEGYVRIGGRFIGRMPSHDGRVTRQSDRELNRLRPKVGLVFQQLNLWPHLTVLENIARAPMRVLGLSREEARSKALALLRRFRLLDKTDAWPAELSGGQRQRVAIARALAMEPEIILLDEPTSALDPEIVGELVMTVRNLAQSGMALIIVTHEIAFAAQVADRILFMDHGMIVEHGPAEQLLRAPKDDRLRSFLHTFSRGLSLEPAKAEVSLEKEVHA